MKKRYKYDKIISVVYLEDVGLYLFWYLVIINLVSAAVCVFDKRRAVRNKWRISEKSLMLLAVLGGGVGMYAAMLAVRHKTRKKKFMIGIPVIIIIETAALIYALH